mmetsp:Transcript_7421/g.27093  ORF Transcript_7421/g.27093 Transcript_7421/m.27093 type:complete len:209 (-) Transcript_7421:60-686(-)
MRFTNISVNASLSNGTAAITADAFLYITLTNTARCPRAGSPSAMTLNRKINPKASVSRSRKRNRATAGNDTLTTNPSSAIILAHSPSNRRLSSSPFNASSVPLSITIDASPSRTMPDIARASHVSHRTLASSAKSFPSLATIVGLTSASTSARNPYARNASTPAALDPHPTSTTAPSRDAARAYPSHALSTVSDSTCHSRASCAGSVR